MSAGKNPYQRYYILNACFTNRQKPEWTKEELIRKLNENDFAVSARTIDNDLSAMRDDKRLGFFAPIKFCRKAYAYHYTDPEYSIDKLPLTSDEIEAFELIVESFKRFRGAQVFKNVAGIFDKLDKVVKQQAKPKKGEVTYSVVDFEKVPNSKGIEHFDKLHSAIIKQQPLLVAYKRFDQPVRDHVFHPYLLKEYKFRWYVLGYSEPSRKKIILALDRIENLTIKKIPFKPYTGIDVQKYFDHTIGVTVNADGVKEVQLWCSVSQGHYFKTQPLHETQQILSDDATGLVLSLQLVINYELLQTLLAFGAEVKVLKPASLQQQVKDMIVRGMKLYELNPS